MRSLQETIMCNVVAVSVLASFTTACGTSETASGKSRLPSPTQTAITVDTFPSQTPIGRQTRSNTPYAVPVILTRNPTPPGLTGDNEQEDSSRFAITNGATAARNSTPETSVTDRIFNPDGTPVMDQNRFREFLTKIAQAAIVVYDRRNGYPIPQPNDPQFIENAQRLVDDTEFTDRKTYSQIRKELEERGEVQQNISTNDIFVVARDGRVTVNRDSKYLTQIGVQEIHGNRRVDVLPEFGDYIAGAYTQAYIAKGLNGQILTGHYLR